MDVLQLGASALQVPPISIGAMFWGTRVPSAVAHDVLDRALDAGAHFIDTANNYAFWEAGAVGDESETCLGAWIAQRGPAGRDRLTLATKIGARPVRAGLGIDHALGLSRHAIQQQVTDSLRRLRTDHVDLLYAHIDDAHTPLAETVAALQEMVDRGWARAIAASNLTAPRLTDALGVAGDGPRYAALQNRFTYLPPRTGSDFGRQVLLDDAVQTACQDGQVTMVAYSTLLAGAYTRADRPVPPAYQHRGTHQALEVLDDVARELGHDRSQTVLAWLTHRSSPVIPVVGISRFEQLDSAITAVSTTVPLPAVARLENARRQAS